MSIIKTIPNIDNEKLTRVARSLIINGDDPENTKLLKAFTVLLDTTPPSRAVLSFDELEGLINILDTTRPIKAKLEPSQWVVLSYNLDDLSKLFDEGYCLTEYVLQLNAESKELTFSGIVTHKTGIEAHPDYDANAALSRKGFEYLIGDFEIIQQMAITRVMATRDSKFEPIAGSYDVSWVYEFSAGGISFATISPGELDE